MQDKLVALFRTVSTNEPDERLFNVEVVLWPKLAQAKLTIGNRSCLLKGEELGKFISWIKEEGFQV